MDLRGELQRLYDENRRLTPAIVLAEAHDPASPLHPMFEWRDGVAAEKWRLHQARELIRSVRVTYREADETNPEKSVRAWHAVRDEEGYGYQPAEQVALDPFQRRLLLADMQREWQQMKRRWADFEEFWRLVAAENERRAG
jgi:hypothetical protein